jgi:putative aminopeptidase FrvX
VAAPATLLRLLGAAGPSGYEQAVAAVFREECAGFAEVTHDTVGSTVARVGGTASGPTLAIVGHYDEIGLIVHHIDDEGFLWFKPVGGWDPQVLVAQRVVVQTDSGPVPGVIGRRPIHLLKEEARKEPVKLEELCIDIGASDGDDARSRVRLGDTAVIDAAPAEYPNGRLISRALDNRLGCYVAIEVARRIAQAGGAPGEVCAVGVSQEETEFGGSLTTAYSLRPDAVVVVDGTWATDQPGVDETKTGRLRLGRGPVLTRGSTLDPLLFDLLRKTAEAEGIEYSVEVTARATGTDADAFHSSRGGIPSAVVCVPMRYLHQPIEMVDLADVEATVALLVAFAGRVTADLDFRR